MRCRSPASASTTCRRWPCPRTNPKAEELEVHAAVRLFLDRAIAVQPTFRLTDRLAGPVAEICRRLDGIPLALELAAARTRSLPVDVIAARLDQRFRLLTTGDRTVLPRQRTLRALIDWSFDLLDERERDRVPPVVVVRRQPEPGGGRSGDVGRWHRNHRSDRPARQSGREVAGGDRNGDRAVPDAGNGAPLRRRETRRVRRAGSRAHEASCLLCRPRRARLGSIEPAPNRRTGSGAWMRSATTSSRRTGLVVLAAATTRR